MSGYYLKAILLENCPYSIEADNLIKKHKLPNQSVWIKGNEKDKYVTDMIQTYPQIYLRRYNTKENLLLGGFTDMNRWIGEFKDKKLNDMKIKEFQSKYNWSRKAVLRFIQLIN
jgi:hypothetical protein